MNLTIDRPSLVIEADHKWPSLQLTGAQAQGISQVYLDGSDEMMDILRLTCIEGGLAIIDSPQGVALKASGQDFQIVYKDAAAAKRTSHRAARQERQEKAKQ